MQCLVDDSMAWHPSTHPLEVVTAVLTGMHVQMATQRRSSNCASQMMMMDDLLLSGHPHLRLMMTTLEAIAPRQLSLFPTLHSTGPLATPLRTPQVSLKPS